MEPLRGFLEISTKNQCNRKWTIIYWVYDYDKEGWEYWLTKEWLEARDEEIIARQNLWGGYIAYEAKVSDKMMQHYLKYGFPNYKDLKNEKRKDY